MDKEKKEIGFIDNGTGKHQSNTVYNPETVSPTITTLVNGGTQQIKIICACRGRESARASVSVLRPARTEYGKQIRKSYKSHAVYEKRKNMQQLEPRTDGLTNTITTVLKDNLVLESMGRSIRVRQATKQGYAECCDGSLADLSYPDSKTRRGRVIGEGTISPTIMANQSEICKMEIIGKSGLPASREELDGIREESRHKKYRIRKLTPLECYRLMGVSDENAYKMLAKNSNTQCYKQAGNSICVPVLMALFSQMNIDGIKPWNDMTEDEIYELIDNHK